MEEMEVIEFYNPDTEETEVYYVIEKTTLSNVNYYLAVEAEEYESDSEEEAMAYIFKETGEDGEDLILERIEDDKEIDSIAKIFSELVDEETDLEF